MFTARRDRRKGSDGLISQRCHLARATPAVALLLCPVIAASTVHMTLYSHEVTRGNSRSAIATPHMDLTLRIVDILATWQRHARIRLLFLELPLS